MLILKQARKKLRSPAKMNSYVLGSLALGVSLPFGILSGQYLQSWMAGLVLGVSLFTYSILLVQLIRRQPPLFIKRFFPRKDLMHSPRSISEITGLRLDYVGAKDPQDTIDGVVHNRAGELQRVLRCALPQRITFEAASLLMEMLFADLSQFSKTRFQIIFPEAENGRRKEMIVIASHMNCGSSDKDDTPPLVQVQKMLDRLMERLITLGISPKVLSAYEVRQLISEELGSCASKSQLNKDWRNVGNLGWEPSFRDNVLKPNDRFMQVAERKSVTIGIEQLPSSGSFGWLSCVLSDIPTAHVSLFISPWQADPLSRLRLAKEMKKHSDANPLVSPAAAQMSFFFRFDGRDPYQLESEVSTARKYFQSLGINTIFHTYKQQQLQHWRSTLPCAQEHSANKHLIAFMRSAG